MSTLIKNARIVTGSEVLDGYCCAFSDGVITYIGKELQDADTVIDAKGQFLVPGFIDIHCHGCLNMSFVGGTAEEFGKMADFHLSHGTTTLLASTSTASEEETLGTLETFKAFKKLYPNSTMEGVNMEGPWLNAAQCGAQATMFMRLPKAQELAAIKEKYPFVLRAAAAPELEGGLEFGRVGAELGVKMSIAHSDAIFTEVEEALENGYTSMTHLYSSMKGMERKNAYRIAGAIEAGLYLDDMYTEVIADGKHLPLELLKLIYKCKGKDRICMVTDATRGCGLPNGAQVGGVCAEGELAVIVEDDVAKTADRQSFAGSTATTDRLYRTMAKAIGRDMVALSAMSSLTPARYMGWDDRGEIAVGKKADLVLLNDDLEVQQVFTDKKNS